jgi:integrase/recombinase XerD
MTYEELESRLQGYLALRIALGFPMTVERYLLADYIRFAASKAADGPLRAETAVEWASQPGPRGGRTSQAHRLSVVRVFLTHLRAMHPEVEVPDRGLIARRQVRPLPYLFSDQDVLSLMAATSALRPARSIRPHVYRTMIGLLAATGLRIGEALHLAAEDVMLDADPPRLRIVDTKFGKTRWVPLHCSTAVALEEYAARRRRLHFDAVTERFFPSEAGSQIEHSLAWRTFGYLAQRADIRAPDGDRQPTWHSLRHTFAVRRLTEWYEQGEDVSSLIPNLSVYLGHLRPEETYWYLTATPALLRAASESFERFSRREGEAQ